MHRLLSAIFEAICLIKMVGTKASCLNVSLLLLNPAFWSQLNAFVSNYKSVSLFLLSTEIKVEAYIFGRVEIEEKLLKNIDSDMCFCRAIHKQWSSMIRGCLPFNASIVSWNFSAFLESRICIIHLLYDAAVLLDKWWCLTYAALPQC